MPTDDIDLDEVWRTDARTAATAFRRYTEFALIFRPRAFALRERLLEWLPERLGDVKLSTLTLSRAADIYMHCSYAITPKKHAIKAALMSGMRRALLEAGCREAEAQAPPPIERRPTIVVVAENSAARPLGPSHAFARDRAPCASVSMSSGLCIPIPKPRPSNSCSTNARDMGGTDVFQLACHLANQILARKPALVFYLGVGMTPLVVALASLRLAPVQCVSFGHTATTMSEAIDHFVLPEDFVASEAVFSERVLALPKAAMPMTPRSSAALRGRARGADGTIRIALPHPR